MVEELLVARGLKAASICPIMRDLVRKAGR